MFDVEVAKQVGVVAAILFQNIAFWCQHSEVNCKNYHDGRYWTYNTNKAFCELFPYLTSKTIRNSLQKLVEADLIVTGNYNEKPYDRTIWYAMSEKGKCIFQKGQMELPKRANGFAPEGKPIPDINTDHKTADNKPDKSISSELPGFIEFWKVYPNKVKKSSAISAWKSGKLENLSEKIIADVKLRCDTEWKDGNTQFVPHPTTYLHQRRWEDETRPQERSQGNNGWHNPALDYAQRDYTGQKKKEIKIIDLNNWE